MTNPVICGISNHQRAWQIVGVARELAFAFERDLLLVHVLPPRPEGAAEPELLIAAMKALRQAATDAEIDPRSWRLEVGSPATRLLALADDFGAAAIVIGAADHGAELGSVARAIAGRAPCPTVIVPAERTNARPPQPRATSHRRVQGANGRGPAVAFANTHGRAAAKAWR